MLFERRRDWWREFLSSVKVLIFLRLLPRRLLRLDFVWWVLLRVSFVWVCVILMPSKHSFSQVWKRMFLCDCPLVVVKYPLK